MLAFPRDGGPSPWRCRARASSILLVALLHEASSVRHANGKARAGHGVSPPSVAVFQEAPELLREVRPEERGEVSRLRVQVTIVDRGPWQPPVPRKAHTHLGLLILDGLVLRRVTLGGRKGAE